MKKMHGAFYVFLVAIISTVNCLSQTTLKDKLVGKWECLDDVECQDILEIEKNGQYNVFNDCYGVDSRTSIIESGNWSFQTQGQIIKLSNRGQSKGGGYFIWNKQSVQDLHVSISNEGVLQIKYLLLENKKDVIETWKRLK